MALCESVYRRGGVYWWRRRLGLEGAGTPPYLRLSLKVREPRRAREMARLVGVEADRLRSIGMLTASQQAHLLRAFIDQLAGRLNGVAGLIAHQNAERGPDSEPIADQANREKIMAAVYAALGYRSVAASIGETEAAALGASGFTPAEIAIVREQVEIFRDCLPRISARGDIAPAGPGGLIGPKNEAIVHVLEAMGVETTAAAIDQARRLWLQSMSTVLQESSRHISVAAPQAQAIYDGMFGASPVSQPVVQTPPAPAAAPEDDKRDYTISGQIAAMVETKTGQEWKITKRGVQDVSDSAESYVFLGRILVKMLGVDDVRKLDAETPMRLRRQLQSLPLNYGKARTDWNLSFDEAIAIAKKAEKPIGRSGATINKYLNFFQSFLSFLEGSGIVVPDISKPIKNAKVKVPKKKASEKRGSFTDAEYVKLFSDDEWCGAEVVHDSTYWVPLFTRYGGGRLEEPCGLMISEMDFDAAVPSYLIQDNEMRTIKTEGRRVPFHSELLRLGFREYCEEIEARGHKEAFPDFRARGEKTAIGSLLDKKFKPILDRALPDARAKKKTQHSNRKTLNTELRDNSIDITIRCELLGHTQEGVNAKDYTDPARDDMKKTAIDTIANVTAHVPRRELRLSQLLQK